jgi:hypothetical protein
MTISADVDVAIRRFDAVMRYYSYETTMYWARSHFFLVANAGLFALSVTAILSRQIERPYLLTFVCIFGVLLSILWYLVLRTGQYWTSRWENICLSLEQAAFGDVEIFRNCRPRRHLSTKLVARFAALLFIVVWTVCAFYVGSTIK